MDLNFFKHSIMSSWTNNNIVNVMWYAWQQTGYSPSPSLSLSLFLPNDENNVKYLSHWCYCLKPSVASREDRKRERESNCGEEEYAILRWVNIPHKLGDKYELSRAQFNVDCYLPTNPIKWTSLPKTTRVELWRRV